MSIQAIFQAIKENDLQTLKLLLQTNPQALHESNNDYFQNTPLLYAAVVADFGIFEWLITQGADWQAQNEDGENAFDLAVFRHANTSTHQRAKVAYLLELGATFEHEVFKLIYQGNQEALFARYVINPDACKAQDKGNNNYWHYAAALGQHELLIWGKEKLQLSVSTPNKNGKTPLLCAAGNGHLGVVQWLLQDGGAGIEEKNNEGGTALLHAAASGHLAVVQWLLQAGGARIKEKDNDGGTALVFAVDQGHLAVVQWLLQAGGARIKEKDNYDRTALLHAAARGHLAVVQWLLQGGGARIEEKDNEGGTALLHAAVRGHLAVVQWLLQAGGAHIEEKTNGGWNALLLAADQGNLAVVQWLLLVGGARIEEKTNRGSTALLHAAHKGHLAVVQWLLRAGGARVEEKDNEGWSALLLAAARGHLAVMQWLLQAGGARIEEKNNQGGTALLHAAHKGHLTVVQWLLQAGGARIEEKDNEGLTALLHTAASGHLAVVQWLLQAGGARIEEKDNEGLTVLLHAAARSHLVVVQWLLQVGGALLEPSILQRAKGTVKTWLEKQKAKAKRAAEKLSQNEKLTSIRLHYLDEEDAILLCQALQSANCSTGLTIDLQNALTSKKVYALLMQVLESGHCPARLSLNLAHNDLGLEGAKMLREVLLKGNGPAYLDLNVSHNNMGSEGYKLLQEVLKDPRCPKGLHIQITADNVQADRYRCVVIEQGRRQLDTKLRYLPPEIWDQVYSYLNPYSQSDIRYPSFPRKVVQVVDKADKDSLILRLKYFVNFFEPNAYPSLAKGNTIVEKSYQWIKNSASNISRNLFYKSSDLTRQFIREIKQLITRSVAEDIRPVLQETLDNYVAKMSLQARSEAATVEQLMKYRLLSYEQIGVYKDIFNKSTDNKATKVNDKQQNTRHGNEQSKKHTYSTFKFFDNSLPHASSTHTELNTNEERLTKRIVLEKQ